MRVGKYIGWFLLLIVLMCLLVLGAIYLLAGTDRGFATLADLLDRRVAGLNINDVTGNLGKGISANRFDYTSETLSVEGQGLSSTWRAGCLLKRQACLDEVTIDRLDIVNLASQDGTNTDNKSESILLPQVNLPVGFTIDKALIKQLSYHPSKDSKPYIIDNIHLSAQSRENTVEINDASLGYENFTVTMNGNIELADDYPLVLAIDIDTTDLLPDTLDGGQGNQAQLVKIRFSDTLSDLTVNAQLAGTVNASLTAVAKPLDRLLPLTATIKSDSISWPLTGERMFSARDLRIELDGDMNDYRVSANSQIDGREIPPGAVEIHGKINTERVDVEKFALDSPGGNALGSATVTLNDTLKWNTNFSLSDIDPSVKWAAYPGSLDATIDASGLLRDGRWSLNLEQMTIVGDLQSYPLELSAKMAKGLNDVWFIDHMRLNNLDNQIEVAGVVEDHWDLKGNIDLPALQHLMPGLQGSLSSQISINGPLQEPDIQVSASTPQITYENSHIDELSFDADIRQLFVDDSAVKLTIESGNLEGQELDGMDFSLSGQRDDHKLSLTAGGPMETALALELTGVLDDQLNWTGIVEKNTS
ncbi:MAG: hypothetical protein KTR32_09045, partial [Granulosicoccus sp.]|nr:hypothetical protein [Granulosicoccus sp.]